MLEKFKALKAKVNMKVMAAPIVGSAVVLGTSVASFASEGGNPSLPSVAITTEMLEPLVEGVVANLNVILPVGLGLFAIFLGIRIIPGIISRFTHA